MFSTGAVISRTGVESYAGKQRKMLQFADYTYVLQMCVIPWVRCCCRVLVFAVTAALNVDDGSRALCAT